MVLINSLGTSQQLWDEMVPLLLREYNVLLFDKRGHGLSSGVEGPLKIDDFADDIIALMDHLGLEQVHPVGLSIGGLITFSLASRYPDRVGKLIFSNTGAKIGTAESWDERIRQVGEKGLESVCEGIVARWLSDDFRKKRPEVARGMVTMLNTCSDEGYIQACRAIREADYRPVLERLSQPALFIGGSADPGTTAEFVVGQAKNLDAEVHIIEGVGHLPCVEAPGEMARVIIEFLGADSGSLYDRGMKTRRQVLGDAHVDRAEAAKTDFDADFQEYIVNSAWGSIWSRPGLTKRERSMITIALLAALGHEEELEMHIRACINTGANEQDILEVFLHTGVYAGVPVTNQAMKLAKKVLNKTKGNNG